jgi:nitrate reductase cytochrome c-type subunit
MNMNKLIAAIVAAVLCGVAPAYSTGAELASEDEEGDPPRIPHKIDKERITPEENTCLGCHDEENATLNAAPALVASHYANEDGKKVVPARRYKCLKCHETQGTSGKSAAGTGR